MPNNKKNEQKNKEQENSKEKEADNKLVIVKFKKSCTPYMKGEKAGLNLRQAGELIERDICIKA